MTEVSQETAVQDAHQAGRSVPDVPKKKATNKKTVAKEKGAPTKQTKSEHPKYADMISEAITTLKERNGSSRYAINKYLKEKYNIDEKLHHHINSALKRGVEKGFFKQIKASFKIGEANKFAKKKTTHKKPEAGDAAKNAKHASTKTAKAAASKSPKGATKSKTVKKTKETKSVKVSKPSLDKKATPVQKKTPTPKLSTPKAVSKVKPAPKKQPVKQKTVKEATTTKAPVSKKVKTAA